MDLAANVNVFSIRIMGRKRSNSLSIPLQRSRDDLIRLFHDVDEDNDGYVCYAELWRFLKRDGHGLPLHVIRSIHEKADRNDDGRLDQEEFIHMVLDPENHYFFKPYLRRYIQILLPPQHLRAASRRVSIDGSRDEVEGPYEDEYSCWPPPIGMVVISIVEIILFFVDVIKGTTEANGPVAKALMYNPHRRREAWRFITYMFVHVGYFHLFVNVLVQILLGTILEMVHRWWRVLLIYFAGVLAGSLGTSIVDPTVKLAGASGGVYALITAHVATIIMNWKEMTYPLVQLMVFLVITVTDVGVAIYGRYAGDADKHIGYAAHFFGAVAGLLVGITILRNLSVTRKERILQMAATFLYVALMASAIIININWKDMTYPLAQLAVFIAITVSDVGYAIYLRYLGQGDSHIGYAAHFFGALAGLLVGIMVLRNLTANSTERFVQKIALAVYIFLMTMAIFWNALATPYFPEEYFF